MKNSVVELKEAYVVDKKIVQILEEVLKYFSSSIMKE